MIGAHRQDWEHWGVAAPPNWAMLDSGCCFLSVSAVLSSPLPHHWGWHRPCPTDPQLWGSCSVPGDVQVCSPGQLQLCRARALRSHGGSPGAVSFVKLVRHRRKSMFVSALTRLCIFLLKSVVWFHLLLFVNLKNWRKMFWEVKDVLFSENEKCP